jgi:hypothetical protein
MNKGRIVAMVDYWTNLLLAPLEGIVREILKRRFAKTDFMAGHNAGSSLVIERSADRT